LYSTEKRSPTLHGYSIILSVFSERKQGLRELYSKTVSLLDLEDVLCSKTRMKLLKLLFNLGQLNTSDLAHKLGANYATTLHHLSLLKTENVVMERLSGKTRFFRFNNSPRAKAIMKLLEEWEH
jgi:DNA-binding transcriptional ArsR family regulator